MSEMALFWKSIRESKVLQGDWLPACKIPVFQTRDGSNDLDENVSLEESDLIVLTQSCDLEQGKTPFVAMCRIMSLKDFDMEQERPLGKKWEDVRKGRHEGLHLLASPISPDDNQAALVVDFRLVVSLPIGYVRIHADKVGERWRLNSPFLEHFSQAFARFFMRVGLPSAIPPFK